MNSGTWIAIGMAAGVGIGTALDQPAIGIAVGAAIGIALFTWHSSGHH